LTVESSTMLPRDCRLVLLLPEVFGREGGIPIIGQDLLEAIARLKTNPQQYPVVIANDPFRPTRPLPSWVGHFRLRNCGATATYTGHIRRGWFATASMLTIAKYRPSLVVCGHVNHSPICHLMKKLLGIPYIVLTYGIEVWDVDSDLKRQALKNANLVAALSRYTRDKLIRRVGLSNEQVIVKPHGVREYFRPAPKPAHLMERFGLRGQRVLLTVARLAKSETDKGYDQVIKALAAVSKEVPNVRYVFVGSGDDVPRIRELAKEEGVAEKVVLPGFVANAALADYYNLCDVFVMPSKKEGLGIVFLEALACGKPVIAGNVDGSRDALLDGKLGTLVNPDSVEDIAKAIVAVLREETPKDLLDPSYLSATVREHFGFDRYCERVSEMITLALTKTRT